MLATKIDSMLMVRKSYIVNIKTLEKLVLDLEDKIETVEKTLHQKKSKLNQNIQDIINTQLNKLHPLKADISALKLRLTQAHNLFSKESLNIGLSGVARVGKSTLLQSISGLNNDQVPTGSSLPVTAVKSTIEYSESEQLAFIEFHSPSSFLSEVIGSYHKQLNISSIPQSIEEFKNMVYPSASDIEKIGINIDLNQGVLKRLIEFQESLESFQEYLFGPSIVTKRLDEIKNFVAYPENFKSNFRPYAAVRSVNIKCKFPMAHIKKLILMDLPGLGDLGADIESHHVNGLKNNIDLVLMIKSTRTGEGFWKKADTETLDLLRKAKPDFYEMQDFIVFIINEDKHGTAEQLRNLEGDIDSHVNQSADKYKLISCQLIDSEMVHDKLMLPILEHLAKVLPLRDKYLIQTLEKTYQDLIIKISDILYKLEKEIEEKSPIKENPKLQGQISNKVDRLKLEIDKSLISLYEKLRNETFSENNQIDNDSYFSTINSIKDELEKNLIDNDLNSENWKIEAVDKIRFDLGAGKLANDELNRIRVKISKAFNSINTYLTSCSDQFFTEINNIFRKHFNELMDLNQDEFPIQEPNPTKHLLLLFSKNLEKNHCYALQQTIVSLLRLRLDFKSDYLPHARDVLNILHPTVITADGNPNYRLQAADERTIERFRKELIDLTRTAIYQYKNALEKQQLTSNKIIFSTLEEFIDALKFDEDVKVDFNTLGFTYKHLLWKNEFESAMIYEDVIDFIKKLRQNIEK